ncbi:PD-(D/E)XK nuclease domain-containing protein [Parasutterella sp.]|uniref:PD-(D/E)XK nuclease domain-containing protein n=1 Tax=Parasutterella sp. TaxID=2049037 RepID=UPI0035209778
MNLLTGSANVNTLSDIGLLTQAGYLTLKRVVGLTAFVAYPNAEVAAAMAQLYSERLLQGQTLEQVGADNVALRLAEEDPEGVVHLFNRIFTSIDYQNYPVRDEATVRAFIQIFLSGAGFSPHIEVHNSQGRSDLEVTVQNRHFVFEFKVARKEESSEEKLEEGLKQMRKRSYGLQHADQEQLRMVLVFSIPKRKFDKWSVVNPEN